jgi:hypothetical protein
MFRKVTFALVLLTAATGASASENCVILWHDWFPVISCEPTAEHKTLTAPEIDPSSSVAGLTMLIGALAVFRDRRKGANG